MATTITVIGQGGIQVGSTKTPVGLATGIPPELHLNQWGLYRLDLNPNPQDRA